CQASCGGSPWFPVREVGPGNPILSDSTGEPPPSTFNYAWDIAAVRAFVDYLVEKLDHGAYKDPGCPERAKKEAAADVSAT
ncbi:hypothetical protein LGM62_40765, partial [Burkholderia contaminans]|nr:hypothetical protein [Burkholderia contaminans]